MLKCLKEFGTSLTVLPGKLEVSQEDFNGILGFLDRKLLPIWEWLLRVMDSTEAQLRFGGSLSSESSGPHSQAQVRNLGRAVVNQVQQVPWTTRTASGQAPPPPEPGRSTTSRESSDSGSLARREFLAYSLSLMRAHNAEHLDSLPVIDVSSLKHIAYVFDALIFFMRAGLDTRSPTDSAVDLENLVVHDPEEPDDMSFSGPIHPVSPTLPPNSHPVFPPQVVDEGDEEVPNPRGKRHIFFQRSDSTLCLGCPAPDPFLVTFFIK